MSKFLKSGSRRTEVPFGLLRFVIVRCCILLLMLYSNFEYTKSFIWYVMFSGEIGKLYQETGIYRSLPILQCGSSKQRRVA
jgi:hypothetical protein